MRLFTSLTLVFFVLTTPLFSNTQKYLYRLKVVLDPSYRLITYTVSKYRWHQKEKFKVTESKFEASKKHLKTYNFKYKDNKLILKIERDGNGDIIKVTQYNYMSGKLVKKIEKDIKSDSTLSINVNQSYYKDKILNHKETTPIRNGLLTRKIMYTYSLYQTRIDYLTSTKIGLKEKLSKDYSEVHYYKPNRKLDATVKIDSVGVPSYYMKYFYDDEYRVNKIEVYKIFKNFSMLSYKHSLLSSKNSSLIKIIYYRYSINYPDISKRIVLSEYPRHYIHFENETTKPKEPREEVKPIEEEKVIKEKDYIKRWYDY